MQTRQGAEEIEPRCSLSMFSIRPPKATTVKELHGCCVRASGSRRWMNRPPMFPSKRSGRLSGTRDSGRRSLRCFTYMARTEVHTYAFSVAANAILSLFPFIVLLLTLCRSVFHSRAMEQVVGDMMRRLSSCRAGLRDAEHAAAGASAQGRAGLLSGDASGQLDGRLPAARGGAEQCLGSDQESQLSAQSDGLTRAGLCGRRAGARLGCFSSGSKTLLAVVFLRPHAECLPTILRAQWFHEDLRALA